MYDNNVGSLQWTLVAINPLLLYGWAFTRTLAVIPDIFLCIHWQYACQATN